MHFTDPRAREEREDVAALLDRAPLGLLEREHRVAVAVAAVGDAVPKPPPGTQFFAQKLSGRHRLDAKSA